MAEDVGRDDLETAWGGVGESAPAVEVDEEEAEAEFQRRLVLNKQRLQEQLRVVMLTEGGRATIWRMLAYCGVFRGPVSDPIDGWRQIGMSDVGRRLLTWVEDADIRSSGIMREEAMARDKEVKHG